MQEYGAQCYAPLLQVVQDGDVVILSLNGGEKQMLVNAAQTGCMASLAWWHSPWWLSLCSPLLQEVQHESH